MTETISDTKPAAQSGLNFDDWALLDGVRTRRVIAFFIDFCIIGLLCMIAVPVIGLIGFATLGAGWLLYAILGPLVSLSYIMWTVGGPKQATVGMQLMDIMLVRYDGQRIDAMTAMVHGVIFWAAGALTSGFAPLLALFTTHKRLIQDLALGTVAVRTSRTK